MIDEIVTMIFWGLITIVSLVCGVVSYEYVYIGVCIMLAAGLLHKEE